MKMEFGLARATSEAVEATKIIVEVVKETVKWTEVAKDGMINAEATVVEEQALKALDSGGRSNVDGRRSGEISNIRDRSDEGLDDGFKSNHAMVIVVVVKDTVEGVKAAQAAMVAAEAMMVAAEVVKETVEGVAAVEATMVVVEVVKDTVKGVEAADYKKAWQK